MPISLFWINNGLKWFWIRTFSIKIRPQWNVERISIPGFRIPNNGYNNDAALPTARTRLSVSALIRRIGFEICSSSQKYSMLILHGSCSGIGRLRMEYDPRLILCNNPIGWVCFVWPHAKRKASTHIDTFTNEVKYRNFIIMNFIRSVRFI